jgi:hypothetical protein
MRPPRFLADADFNHKIVVGLHRREPSVDFMGALDGGVIGLPDSRVISVAAQAGRILVSHDRKTMPGHFARFGETRSSPGIIIVSQDLDIGAAIEDLVLIWQPRTRKNGATTSDLSRFELFDPCDIRRLGVISPNGKAIPPGVGPKRRKMTHCQRGTIAPTSPIELR